MSSCPGCPHASSIQRYNSSICTTIAQKGAFIMCSLTQSTLHLKHKLCKLCTRHKKPYMNSFNTPATGNHQSSLQTQANHLCFDCSSCDELLVLSSEALLPLLPLLPAPLALPLPLPARFSLRSLDCTACTMRASSAVFILNWYQQLCCCIDLLYTIMIALLSMNTI